LNFKLKKAKHIKVFDQKPFEHFDLLFK